jgi:hypothetical protein
MKKIAYAGLILLGLSMTTAALAQSSLELHEACFMDVELTDNIVQLIETGSADFTNVVTTEEVEQIKLILNSDETQALSTVSEKLTAVLTACAERQILQTKNSAIISNQ